jgi:hypothetical protein
MEVTQELALQIFEAQKQKLLSGYKPDNNPIAGLLGGQGASGKSYLSEVVKRNYPDKEGNILFINGDTYREFYPNAKELMKSDRDNYSAKTQIFSNVFTEELIKEAVKNKFNVIIEGTMRNPDVPNSTAVVLKANNYKVDAYIIAANPVFTELGVYRRYDEQMKINGMGRLAEMPAHNEAAKGLLKSADRLFDNKSVDSINLYSYQTRELLRSYKLKDGKWDGFYKPSVKIEQERAKQVGDAAFLEKNIQLGKKTLKSIDDKLKSEVSAVLDKIRTFQSNLSQEQSNGIKIGF